MRLGLILTCASVLAAGCSVSEAKQAKADARQQQLAAAQSQLDRYERKLNRARDDIAAAEATVAKAKADAEFEECRATVEKTRAEVTARRMRCARAVATTARCVSEQERNRATATAGGALLGLGIAIATGGAALPLVGGGLLVGAATGEAIAAECPMPQCVESLANLEHDVLDEIGLGELPMCGGYLGFTVEPVMGVIRGLPIVEVGPQSAAEIAGIREGDLVVAINDARAATREEVGRQLSRVRADQTVTIGILRDGAYSLIEATLRDVNVDGERDWSRGHLGVRFAGAPVATQYERVARVSTVDETGPAAGKLKVGDLVSVNSEGIAPRPSLAVMDAARLRRVGEVAEVVVERDNGGWVARIPLAERPDSAVDPESTR